MASIFGHFAAGYTSAKVINGASAKSVVILAMISSFLPDADVIGFGLGVEYGDFWGHRGFTHSIAFAMIWAAICTFFYKENRGWVFSIIALATASHGILDMMTTGGMGVALFSPIDNGRYFFPWRPIKVSPIGISRFFGVWGLKVILSELIFVLLPCAIILGIKKLIKKTIEP